MAFAPLGNKRHHHHHHLSLIYRGLFGAGSMTYRDSSVEQKNETTGIPQQRALDPCTSTLPRNMPALLYYRSWGPSGDKRRPAKSILLLPHGMREWNPRVICCHTRDLRSRDGAWRGLVRPRRAPPLAPTPGAHRTPGLPALSPSRTSSHATLIFR